MSKKNWEVGYKLIGIVVVVVLSKLFMVVYTFHLSKLVV